jgi:hypothetical protein
LAANAKELKMAGPHKNVQTDSKPSERTNTLKVVDLCFLTAWTKPSEKSVTVKARAGALQKNICMF